MNKEAFLRGFEKEASIARGFGKLVGRVKETIKATKRSIKSEYAKGRQRGMVAAGKAPREAVKETTGLKGFTPKSERKGLGLGGKAAIGATALATSAGGGAYAHKKYKEADTQLASRTESHPAYYQ